MAWRREVYTPAAESIRVPSMSNRSVEYMKNPPLQCGVEILVDPVSNVVYKQIGGPVRQGARTHPLILPGEILA